ncbi:hypothetical protein BDZ89DRAFT_1081666 [Hymenopellis radicata]|nr:hypothetical protein BDZ89DRAFT_1081666 [Hymenopellis radicata]
MIVATATSSLSVVRFTNDNGDDNCKLGRRWIQLYAPQRQPVPHGLIIYKDEKQVDMITTLNYKIEWSQPDRYEVVRGGGKYSRG